MLVPQLKLFERRYLKMWWTVKRNFKVFMHNCNKVKYRLLRTYIDLLHQMLHTQILGVFEMIK